MIRRRPDSIAFQASDAHHARRRPAVYRHRADPATCHRAPGQCRHRLRDTPRKPEIALAALTEPGEVLAHPTAWGVSDRAPKT